MTVKIYFLDLYGRCTNRHLTNVFTIPFIDEAKLLQAGQSTLMPLMAANSFSIGDIIICTGARSNDLKLVRQSNKDPNEDLYIGIVCYYDIATSRPSNLDCSNIIRNLFLMFFIILYAYFHYRLGYYI